jgi:hypothetical protein
MDILLVDGDLTPRGRLVTGDDETLQRVRLRLDLFLGEWVLDQTEGLPWLAWLSSKASLRVEEIGAVLRSTTESTPGINRVLSWSGSYDYTTRAIGYTGSFLLDSGVTVEGEVAVSPAAPAYNASGWLVMSFHRR